jgi:hypothetical protein
MGNLQSRGTDRRRVWVVVSVSLALMVCAQSLYMREIRRALRGVEQKLDSCFVVKVE